MVMAFYGQNIFVFLASEDEHEHLTSPLPSAFKGELQNVVIVPQCPPPTHVIGSDVGYI